MGKSKEMDQQQPGKSEKMEVEKRLMKYASLSVRTGKSTPSEAKILVESKANSSPPREGQEVVVVNSEADWQSLFEEAEKLRQEDRQYCGHSWRGCYCAAGCLQRRNGNSSAYGMVRIWRGWTCERNCHCQRAYCHLQEGRQWN